LVRHDRKAEHAVAGEEHRVEDADRSAVLVERDERPARVDMDVALKQGR